MNRALRTGGLVALLLLLAALAWWAKAGGMAGLGTRWQPPPPQPPQLESVLAATLIPRSNMQVGVPALLQRPLFHASRRPPPPVQPAAPAQQPAQTSLDKLRLLGVLDSAALAGVMALVDDETRFLKRGDQVGGWTLTGIRGRHVTFASHGEQRVLELPHAHTALSPDKAVTAPEASSHSAPAGAAVRPRRP